MTAPALSREDWLEAGLSILAEHGPGALTVARLCAATGRTKGSFYHHFAGGADAFAEALVEHWRETHTERIIRSIDGLNDPARRRAELDRLATQLHGGVERAMRRWAATDPYACAVLRTVDERRIAYLARVIRDATGAGEQDAAELAQIEYAAFVGFLWLFPEADEVWGKRIAAKMNTLAVLWAEHAREAR